MIKRIHATLALLGATMLPVLAGGMSSSPISVNTSLRENRNWETIRTNEVDVAWRWLPNAASATLTITGMEGTVLTTSVGTSVSNVLWQVFAPGPPNAENQYELTLAFYGADAEVVGAQTSHVAVIKGAFGGTVVDPDPQSAAWGIIRGNVVIPYDAGWSGASAGLAPGLLIIENVGGPTLTQPLATGSGYWGWKVRGSGVFDLTLGFEDVAQTWTAELLRHAPGTVLSVR